MINLLSGNPSKTLYGGFLSVFLLNFIKNDMEEHTMDIFAKVCEVLADHTGRDASEFTPDSTFESLGIDSLETVEMVMELEEELDTELELDQKVATLGELVAFIESKLD